VDVEPQVKGRGCILACIADYEGWTEVLSPDEWRAALQLPASYDIESVSPTNPPGDVVLISVQHEQIPMVKEDDYLPYVWLVYQGDKAGNRVLQHIEIQQYSEADGWRTVAVTDEQQ
jgi:hypothetical protein